MQQAQWTAACAPEAGRIVAIRQVGGCLALVLSAHKKGAEPSVYPR